MISLSVAGSNFTPPAPVAFGRVVVGVSGAGESELKAGSYRLCFCHIPIRIESERKHSVRSAGTAVHEVEELHKLIVVHVTKCTDFVRVTAERAVQCREAAERLATFGGASAGRGTRSWRIVQNVVHLAWSC